MGSIKDFLARPILPIDTKQLEARICQFTKDESSAYGKLPSIITPSGELRQCLCCTATLSDPCLKGRRA